MSEGGRKVEFLIAGVQKAGTSALFDYLRDVPALQLPNIKEAHFFDNETNDWARPDYTSYHGLFTHDDRLWGEATPIYCYWPNSLERIQAYNPGMRIILVFRDPIERAWSHWKMEYAKRKETEPFDWCIREGRRRVVTGDETGPSRHRVFSYVERGFYAAQLDRLLALFPARQTLLLRQDDLEQHPNDTIKRICAFLGVAAPDHPLTPRRVREALRIDYLSILRAEDRHYLAEMYRHDVDQLAMIAGWDLSGWLRV